MNSHYATIDRSRPAVPLTLPWVRTAFLISLVLFAALPAVAVLALGLGLVWCALCYLAVIVIYIFFYGIALLPVFLGIAAVVGAYQGSGDKKEHGGAMGCLGVFVLFIILKSLLESLWGWAVGSVQWAAAGPLSGAEGGWKTATGSAWGVWDAFRSYGIYQWSWAVLALALASSVGTIGLIGLARSERPLRRFLGRIRWQCPYCNADRPRYLCPGPCGTRHDPRPSRYGIWTARCRACGTSFGTTALSGLLRLKKVCGDCQTNLDHPDLGRFPEYHIAVVGAKNSGKTNLLVAALRTLEVEFAPAFGLTLAFANDVEERDYRNRVARLNSGSPQDQTQRSTRPIAFTVGLRPKAGGEGALLYLYDAAGEDIQAGDAGATGITGHDFHQFVDGVLLVVDPFAEAGLRQPLAAGRSAAEVKRANPAPHDVSYILGRMLPFWSRTQRVSAQGRFHFPVAVTLTKADACGLAERVGGYPEPVGLERTFRAASAEASRFSEGIQRLLAENGSEDVLRLVDSHFRKARYFAVSSLGRPPAPADHSPFKPRAAIAPLAWLLVELGALSDSPRVILAAQRAIWSASRCLRGAEGPTRQIWAWTILAVSVVAIMVFFWRP
jgi:hypothetical protein